MVEFLPHTGGTRLLLKPNRSLSWRGNVLIWIGLVVISLTIALGWSLMGAWVVLPFAGIELIAVGTGIYLTSRDCHRQELVTLQGDDIILEKGHAEKEISWTLPRPYTRLQYHEPKHAFAVAKLSFRHRDNSVPVGDFLNQEDTAILLRALESGGILVERKRPDPEIGLWY